MTNDGGRAGAAAGAPVSVVVLVLTALACLHAGPSPIGAQSAAQLEAGGDGRPTIGLVLSGGGARGFAHLGVLRVLDELRIPVDVIAATSMGAVVGGIYATGIPFDDLDRMFTDEDWAEIFRDDPPRRELPMRRKRDDRELYMDFEVGINRTGVRLPPSLISTAKLTNALGVYTYRARSVDSFDDLPIPFRAVATDVADGSMVVLEGGDLGHAIRASMAVPGAFAPQVVGGRSLVDGGLVRNTPVDVARAMGADVVIVSDVTTGLDEAPDANDPLSMASRLVTVMTSGPTRDQIASLTDADVYLRPDLQGVASADFAALDTARIVGVAAARAQAGRLTSLSLPADEYDTLVRQRSERFPAMETLVPGAVRVYTDDTALRGDVIEELVGIEPGDTLTLNDLRVALTRALGYGGFQSIEFDAVGEPPDETLEIRPRDKSWGPLFARAGLSLADRQQGTGAWSLRGVVDWTRLAARGGEAQLEIELGTRHGFAGWAHLPLTRSDRFFATLRANIGRTEVFPEVSGLPLGLDLTDRAVLVGAGVRLGWWGEARIGVRAGHYDLLIPSELGDSLEDDGWAERSVEVLVEADILDRADFPSSGARATATLTRAGTVAGGTDAFTQLVVEGLAVTSFGSSTITAMAVASTGFGRELPFYRSVPLGGIDRMTGADRDAIRGTYAGMARVGWSYRLGAPATAPGGGLRVGLSVEGGQGWYSEEEVDVTFDSILWGASAWVGLSTPIGPVRFAYAVLEGRDPGWVVQLGAPR